MYVALCMVVLKKKKKKKEKKKKTSVKSMDPPCTDHGPKIMPITKLVSESSLGFQSIPSSNQGPCKSGLILNINININKRDHCKQ